MNSIEITAPAKVNLFLKILNKRRDSYHNILTIFERIAIADKIKINKAPHGGIIISTDKFITANPRDNLAYKAAQLIIDYRRLKTGVRIYIKKKIPIAAGLGGGSSDAAAVLIGMNRLFNLRLKTKDLLGLGRRLGADVPFFVLNTPFAIGRGVGDRLEIMNSNARFWHLIIYPGFKLSTRGIYEAFDRQGRALSNHLTRIPSDDRISSLKSMLYNDLEVIAVAKKAVIGKIIDRLAYILDIKAILSGSGPSVFCLYETRKEAIRAKSRLLHSIPARDRKSWQLFIARTEG